MTLTVRREHAGGATPTTTVATVAASGSTISITEGTGWPTGLIGPFVVTIGRGTNNEERILCSGRTGSVLTVAAEGRGWDGTVAREHPSGSTIEHTWSTTEADESSAHASAVAAHGVDVVVGTTEIQELTNKTLSAPVITNPAVSGGGSLAGTITGSPTFSGNPTFSGAPVLANFTSAQHDHGDADDGGNIPQASVTGLVAGLATKASLTGSETLTNKTLTAPAITSPTITSPTIDVFNDAQHDHSSAAEGGIPNLSYFLNDNWTARTINTGEDLVLASATVGEGLWMVSANCNGFNTNGVLTRIRFYLEAVNGTFGGVEPESLQGHDRTGYQSGWHIGALWAHNVGAGGLIRVRAAYVGGSGVANTQADLSHLSLVRVGPYVAL